MKKFLCLLLSFVLVIGPCMVVSASAEDTTAADESDFDFEEKFNEWLGGFSLDSYVLPDFSGYDIDALIASGALDEIDVGGVSLGFIYNSTEALDWNKMAFDASTIYLVMGNLNVYFKNLIFNEFSDTDKYNSANATWLANKIVDIFFGPTAPDVSVTLSKTGDVDVFVEEIIFACRSGFTSLIELIQTNWVDAKINFWPVLYALGVDLYDIYDKTSAKEILEETLKALIVDFLEKPVYTFLDIFWAFARSYKNFMVTPMAAALSTRISEGAITVEQLDAPHNLFNLIFNNNINTDTSHLQFLTIPYQRFAVAVDRTECFYYAMIYMILLGSYGNNGTVFDGYKSYIQTKTSFEQSDKDTICSLIDGFAGGNLGNVITFVQNMLVQNITDSAQTFLQKLINMIRDMLEGFINSLDKIFGFSARWS